MSIASFFANPPASGSLAIFVCALMAPRPRQAAMSPAVSQGGTMCHVPNSYGEIMEAPSWWEPVTVPFWLPDTNSAVMLKEAIAGHVSVQADTPKTNELTH